MNIKMKGSDCDLGRILDNSDEQQDDDILQLQEQPVAQTKKQQPVAKVEQDEPTPSNNNDILGSLADLGLRFFVVIVVSMLDCIEQTFANMSYASGKSFKWVLLVVATYLPVSLLSPLFGYATCITWQDAIIAFIVTLALYAVNGVNRATINGAVSRIKEVSNRVVEGGKQRVKKK